MALNVCLRCGELKNDALTCPACAHRPATPQEQARQIVASEVFQTREELEAIARTRRAGETITFDQDAIAAGYQRQEVQRLTNESGTVPPPWVLYDEHPYSICWRMGGGEGHMMLWWEWWPGQGFSEDEKIAYFRRWPPPHCWLPFLIEAIWGVDTWEERDNLGPYFARTSALGFGTQQDYERDLDDPSWLEELPDAADPDPQP